MLRRVALGVLVASIVVIAISYMHISSGAYSGMFQKKETAEEVCKDHKGTLGQAAGTPCGLMVGSVCRKGTVNADRNECTVPSFDAAELGMKVGAVALIGSVVLLLWPKSKAKGGKKST